MTFYCKYCGSENIANDALVHANTGEVITTYDNAFCLDCGKENSWLESKDDETKDQGNIQSELRSS